MVATYFKKPIKVHVQASQLLHTSDNNTLKKEQIIGDIFTTRPNSHQTKSDAQLINVCQVP